MSVKSGSCKSPSHTHESDSCPCSCPTHDHYGEDGFRSIVSDDSDNFKIESGRYHLYAAYGCPFASRALITLHMKGLQNAIGVSLAHPSWLLTKPDVDKHAGWVFRSPEDPPVTPQSGYGSIPCDGCVPDTVNQCQSARELYELSADKLHRYSLPILWDKHCHLIVNNESADILRMFNSKGFAVLAAPGTSGSPDLYPAEDGEKRKLIDETNDWVGQNIISAVYRAGYAKDQHDYNTAVTTVFEHLDRVESLLSSQRYLCGAELTEADVRLYTFLIRFDEVYYVIFKCNKKHIWEYPNMFNYLRELWQIPCFKNTTNIMHIKRFYYTSTPALNSYSIIPIGRDILRDLQLPHDRERNYS
mmetsp:Transcript_11480/g.11500  ORF Transcript_11480/g.11500 Transcript_11480/m.11500 type:complete len:359 (+) Transcript_11480:67-1143(+)